MIPVAVADLRKGDVVQVAEDSVKRYTVVDRRGDSDASLVRLELQERDALVLPRDTMLYGVHMYRLVKVPCVIHRDDVEFLYDVASGATPRAVLCGDCDAKVTAEVMERMERDA